MTDVTSVNTTESGRTYVTGQSTNGIDTNALIDASYNQKLEPAVTIDEKVEENVTKSEAYIELQSLAQGLEDSLSGLSTPQRGSDTNLFDSKSGTVSSNSSTPAESLVNVSIDASSQAGSYSLEVLQTAEAMTVISGNQTSDDEALGLEGVFSLGLEGGSSEEIEVTEDMSLNDIAASINVVTEFTGVTAMVVLVAEGQYALSMSGINEALLIEAVFVSGGNVLQSLVMTDGNGNFQQVVQPPQPAQVNYNGIQIERQTNELDDVIEGVEIDLKNAQPGTEISIEIETDASSVKNAIMGFVDSYKTFAEFVSAQQVVPDPEAEAEDQAKLFADGALRNLDGEINRLLVGVYNEPGDSIRTLEDIGISINSAGEMSIDEVVLDDALLNNYDQVRGLFETQISVEGAGDQAEVLTNNYEGENLSFTVDVTTDAQGNMVGASVNGDDRLFEVRDSRIIGVKDGPYDGITIAYVGDEDVSLEVKVSAGLGNQVSHTIDRYSDPESGILQGEIRQISDENAQLEEDAARIRERADVFLDREIEKYSAMESAIKAAESVQNYIAILFGTNDDDD